MSPTIVSEEVHMKNLTINAIYDDAVLGSAPIADADDVERALATAASLHADKSAWSALHQRVAILERLAQLMHDRPRVVEGRSASGRVDLGGRRSSKTKNHTHS